MAREKGVKQPIRDMEKIQLMKDWLLEKKSYRDYFLFFLGLNTGLRIGDLVSLKVSDIRNKDLLSIWNEKTKKFVYIPVNEIVRFEINKYCKMKADSDFVFPSRQGGHLTTRRADQTLKEAAEVAKIENWGTHSMRKTFGYRYYSLTKDVYFLMKLFGHRTQSQTLQYIGIELEEIRETMKDLVI